MDAEKLTSAKIVFFFYHNHVNECSGENIKLGKTMKKTGKIFWNIGGSLKVLFATLPISMTMFGGASAAPGDFTAWQRAQETNTVLAYSEFILNHAESLYTDEAFCALFELDSIEAAEVVEELKNDYRHLRVNFDTCATTSSARLLNI